MSKSVQMRAFTFTLFVSMSAFSFSAQAAIADDDITKKLADLSIVFIPVVVFLCYFFYVQKDRKRN